MQYNEHRVEQTQDVSESQGCRGNTLKAAQREHGQVAAILLLWHWQILRHDLEPVVDLHTKREVHESTAHHIQQPRTRLLESNSLALESRQWASSGHIQDADVLTDSGKSCKTCRERSAHVIHASEHVAWNEDLCEADELDAARGHTTFEQMCT